MKSSRLFREKSSFNIKSYEYAGFAISAPQVSFTRHERQIHPIRVSWQGKNALIYKRVTDHK